MNYTREPIIETIISAKDGSRLVVRNSKRASEEYFVDALEVVSFGSAVFYRSTERPKSFLLPITDYEVIELKETKMVLKSASYEQSIKIGGGKEETKSSKRKKTHKKAKPITEDIEKPQTSKEKGGEPSDETQVSSSILRKLFPPPPNLIKEKLNHIKSPEKIDESISKEIVKEDTKKEAQKENPKQADKEPIKEEAIVEEKAQVKQEVKETLDKKKDDIKVQATTEKEKVIQEDVKVEKILEPTNLEASIEQRIEKEKKEE